MKYMYRIEADLFGQGWVTIAGEQDGSLEYMRGRFAGFHDQPGPRPAFRLVRTSVTDPTQVKVLQESPALLDLSVGMLPQSVGHQWQILAEAAAQALRRAALDVRHAARHDPQLTNHQELFNAAATYLTSLTKNQE